MEKSLFKIAVGLAVVVVIAYVVATRVNRRALAQHKQSRESRTWQSPIVAAPMADEAFVNYYRS